MRCCGDGLHGDRARGLIAGLWRAGLRIQEALDLTELDLADGAARCSSDAARVAGAARSGWTTGASNNSSPGCKRARRCRSDRCSASSTAAHEVARGIPPRHGPRCAVAPPTPVCVAASRRTIASRARAGAAARGRAAECHPTPTRAPQPRRHLDLPLRHRPRRDHPDRPRSAPADDSGQHGTRAPARPRVTTDWNDSSSASRSCSSTISPHSTRRVTRVRLVGFR